MTMRAIVNTLIIGSILVILYVFAGHNFVKFFFSGKNEILEAGTYINKLCNTKGLCPTKLAGWQVWRNGSKTLFKDNMLYYVTPIEGNTRGSKSKEYDSFRIVYRFAMPDHWFEVQGGVNKTVTSGWKSR